MKHLLHIDLETPDVAEGRRPEPYVIEALLTYVRGVETGAFGTNAVEKFTTITRCRLRVTYSTVEEKSNDADRHPES